MPEGGYKIVHQDAVHFLTFAVVGWADVFTRSVYADILLDSLRHCIQAKGLILHGWVIMPNHVHLIAKSATGDLSGTLRDLKKFTSARILNEIRSNPKESRREWLLALFQSQAADNARNADFQFWQQDNHPVELITADFTAQRLNYLHENPVRAGLVRWPPDYRYSSALDYYRNARGLLDIALLEL